MKDNYLKEGEILHFQIFCHIQDVYKVVFFGMLQKAQ